MVRYKKAHFFVLSRNISLCPRALTLTLRGWKKRVGPVYTFSSISNLVLRVQLSIAVCFSIQSRLPFFWFTQVGHGTRYILIDMSVDTCSVE